MKRNVALLISLVVFVFTGGCGQDTTVTPVGIESAKVTKVIDGDTIELDSGQRVRFIGIDTPEKGECGYTEATQNMKKLVLNKRIVLVSDGTQGQDMYDRLLRYVDMGGMDVGLEQIKDGLAVARYDSTDGYPKHSRQARYHEEDDKKENLCPSK